jgi:hypothetical protein
MAREVDTFEFRTSHWTEPRGRGNWIFENKDSGEEVTLQGPYSKVVRQLPAGSWKVLP